VIGDTRMYLTYYVRLVGMKRRNWLWGWRELKASKCLLLCRDVQYIGSLYFSAAPQVLIFMNVPLPVFELLHSERHCTVSRHHFWKFRSNKWTLCVLSHTIKTEPNSWTGPVCRMNACIVYRRMLVDKCMYMRGVATTQLVGVTGEPPPQSFLSKAVLENSHEQQCWIDISWIPQQEVFHYVAERQYWLRSVRQWAVLLPYGWLDECRQGCIPISAYLIAVSAACLASKRWSVLWGLDLRDILVYTQCKPSFPLQVWLTNICLL